MAGKWRHSIEPHHVRVVADFTLHVWAPTRTAFASWWIDGPQRPGSLFPGILFNCADSLAAAKQAAEDALRRLCAEALAELGPGGEK